MQEGSSDDNETDVKSVETDRSAAFLLDAVSTRYQPNNSADPQGQQLPQDNVHVSDEGSSSGSRRPVPSNASSPLWKADDMEQVGQDDKSTQQDSTGPRMMMDEPFDETRHLPSEAIKPGAIAVAGGVHVRPDDSRRSATPQEELSSSIPLTANLVPDVEEEEKDIEALVQQRVQQEVEATLRRRQDEQQARNPLLVPAVPIAPSGDKTDDDVDGSQNNSICGITMTARCKLLTGAILLLVLVIVAGVAIGVAVSVTQNNGNDSENDNSMTPLPIPSRPSPPPATTPTDMPSDQTIAPSYAPTEDRLPILLQLFGDFFPKENRSVLADSSTNQNRALVWLAYEDPAQIDLKGLGASPEGRESLLERYVAFLLLIDIGMVEYNDAGLRIEADVELFGGEHVCEWNIEMGVEGYGIYCDPQQRIDALWLELVGLTGSIPTEIGLLSNLASISLEHNQLSSTIPSEIGRLTHLLDFFVSGNFLSGLIPTEFGLLEDLIFFEGAFNMFQGELPRQFVDLEHLEWVSLNGNSMEGTLDPIFCQEVSSHPSLQELVADCDGIPPQVECSCCTTCCSTTSDTHLCVPFDSSSFP